MMLNLLNTYNNNKPNINVDSYMIIQKLTNMDNEALNQYDNHLSMNIHSTIPVNKSKKKFPIKMNKINKEFVNQILIKDKIKNFKINTDNNIKESNRLLSINSTLNNNSLNHMYSKTNENIVTKNDKYNYNKTKSLNKFNSIQSIKKIKENNKRYETEKKYKLILQEKNTLISKLKNEMEYYKNYSNNNNNLNRKNTLNSLNALKTNINNQFNTIEVSYNKKNYFLSTNKKNKAHYLGLNSSSANSSSSKNIFGLNKSNDNDMEIVTGDNIIANLNGNYYLNNKTDKKILIKGNDLIRSQLNIFKKYNQYVTNNIINSEKKDKLNDNQNSASIDIIKNYIFSPVKISNIRKKIKLDSLGCIVNNSVNTPKKVIYSLNTTSSDQENLGNGSIGSKIINDDIFEKNKNKMENIKNRMDNLCKNLFAVIENKINKSSKIYKDDLINNK